VLAGELNVRPPGKEKMRATLGSSRPMNLFAVTLQVVTLIGS
jgi:hypothetical protein